MPVRVKTNPGHPISHVSPAAAAIYTVWKFRDEWTNRNGPKPLEPIDVHKVAILEIFGDNVWIRWTVRDDSSSAAAQCSVGHPLVLHQWSQDDAHRTLPTGRCPQDAAHRTLLTGRCPQDTASRTLPTGICAQDAAHRTLPTGHCPQDTAHRTLPTGRCPQDAVSWIVLCHCSAENDPPHTSYLLRGGPMWVLPIEEQGNTVYRETDELQSVPVELQGATICSWKSINELFEDDFPEQGKGTEDFSAWQACVPFAGETVCVAVIIVCSQYMKVDKVRRTHRQLQVIRFTGKHFMVINNTPSPCALVQHMELACVPCYPTLLTLREEKAHRPQTRCPGRGWWSNGTVENKFTSIKSWSILIISMPYRLSTSKLDNPHTTYRGLKLTTRIHQAPVQLVKPKTQKLQLLSVIQDKKLFLMRCERGTRLRCASVIGLWKNWTSSLGTCSVWLINETLQRVHSDEMKLQLLGGTRSGAASPLSAEDELGSDGDCVAHSPAPPTSVVSPVGVAGAIGSSGGGATGARTDSKGKPYTRRPKPPYSYIALIAMAIRDSSSGRLTLAEINDYLMRKFPFFRGSYTGWRNSVRHNLSLNDCFLKVLRDPSRPWGKDNYWMLNPHSEYTFADGVFRRRRKRIGKKKQDEEEEEEEEVSKRGGRVAGGDVAPNSSGSKFSSSFAIDSILSTPFRSEEKRQHQHQQQQQQLRRDFYYFSSSPSSLLLFPPPLPPPLPLGSVATTGGGYHHPFQIDYLLA
ncbi:hypothetical protein NFI96_013390 [Prochilodus magdalenae]|nr:hypothetical protein NFI96_013390 [Prochilodus magdalenae]